MPRRELIHLADSALYWSKAHGRNQSWIYDPAVIQELTDMERAQRLRRAQAVEGLRGLARSIDDREPATREHSERVALIATKLARAVGYGPEDVVRVGEAARLHELGRLASAPTSAGPLGAGLAGSGCTARGGQAQRAHGGRRARGPSRPSGSPPSTRSSEPQRAARGR